MKETNFIERKPKKAVSLLRLPRFLSLQSIFLFMLIIFAQPLSGQSFSLEQVSELLAKNPVTRGRFVLERKAAKSSRVLKSSGDFAIASDYGIIWKTTKPIKSTQVVGKDFSLTESASGKRVKMDSSENRVYLQMAILTSSLWTNNLQAVKETADIKFSCQDGAWQLELFPKDQAVKMALEKILVSGTVAKNQAAARVLTMQLKGGNTACYNMSEHFYDKNLSDSELEYFR